MKRVSLWLAVALVALAGGLFWAVSYRPVIEAGRTPVAGPYVLPQAVAGLKLHVFNTGMNRMSWFLVGDARPWRPVPAFVIEHPNEGLIVFDAGLPAAVETEGADAFSIPTRWVLESKGYAARTLDRQMEEAGLDPTKVKWVILSHMHEDHLGAVTGFPNASFMVGPGVSGDGLAPDFHPKWKSASFAGTKALPPFDGKIVLFGDGSVTLAPGGGHAHEGVMALLALPSGPALLAGDAVVHLDWLASDDVQRVPVDPERAADVRNEVRALMKNDPQVVLFPGHDLDGVPEGRADIVLHHPEWFSMAGWDAQADHDGGLVSHGLNLSGVSEAWRGTFRRQIGVGYLMLVCVPLPTARWSWREILSCFSATMICQQSEGK